MQDRDSMEQRPEEQPAGGRDYRRVGLAFFALVLVLLVGAFILDRRLSPSVGIEAPKSAAVLDPAVRPTMVPTQAVAVAMPTQGAPAVTPTLPGGLRLGNSPLEREIEAAYLNYWRVYSDALLNLDDSHLSEVLSSDALVWVSDEVRELRSEGHPVKIDVDHAYALTRTTPTSATVIDEYISRSVYVDPQTKQPRLRTDPPRRVQQSFEMRKIDGTWKVVSGSREVIGEVKP